MQVQPLIVIQIELGSNRFAEMKIYNDTDPEQLARSFIRDNQLPSNYLNPLKQNIIKQMCLYDSLKQGKGLNHDKENQNLPPKSIIEKQKDTIKINHESNQKNNKTQRQWESEKVFKEFLVLNFKKQPIFSPIKQKTPSRHSNSTTQHLHSFQSTDQEMEVYEKLYQQFKQINDRKMKKIDEDRRRKELEAINDQNLTFKPKINQKSKSIFSAPKFQVKAVQPKSHPVKLQTAERKPPSPVKSNRSQTPLKTPKQQLTKKSVSPLKKTVSQATLVQKNNHEAKVSILQFESPQQPLQIDQYHSSQFGVSDGKPAQTWTPVYTEDQIENSFSDLIQREFLMHENDSDRGVQALFRLLDYDDDSFVDLKQIPFERLSSQLIVRLRYVLKDVPFQKLNFKQFSEIVNQSKPLLQTINDFFG